MFIVAYLQQWSDVVSEYRSKYVLKWNVKALYTCIVTLWSLLWTSVIPSIQKHYYDGDIESLSDFVYVPEQNHCKNITWWPVHLKSIITGISCHRWLWTLFKWHFNGSRWAGEPKCSVTRLKNDIEECILIFFDHWISFSLYFYMLGESNSVTVWKDLQYWQFLCWNIQTFRN